jgi:hypothetical protein
LLVQTIWRKFKWGSNNSSTSFNWRLK